MLILIVGLSIAAFTGEPKAAPPKGPAARVECHGKLHCGLMAIGGETTGTTINFDGIIWELKLTDDEIREFAKNHNKKPVTVVGTLRCVAGTERKARWVVDVTSLTDRNVKLVKDGGTMTVQGTLQNEAPSAGAKPQLAIVADGITWPLDASQNADLQAKAESLATKTVLVSGKVEHLAERVFPLKMKLSIDKLEVAPTTTARR